jgi:hypothetical protein
MVNFLIINKSNNNIAFDGLYFVPISKKGRNIKKVFNATFSCIVPFIGGEKVVKVQSHIVFSVLLQFKDSDYPFDILKLFIFQSNSNVFKINRSGTAYPSGAPVFILFLT